MRELVVLSAVIACGYLMLITALYVIQRQLLYLPDRSLPSTVDSGVPEMTAVRLRTEDGLDLLAWYRAAEAGKATVLYLHGNAGHIGYRGGRVRPFLNDGLGVLLLEYRGFGGNPGEPSEAGLMSDARAAFSFLESRGIEARQTILYGESLGSVVAVATAADWAVAGEPVGGLILEAPLSSVREVAAYHYPWVPVRWLLKDRFEAAERIGEVAAPLLIVHGDADRIVPLRYGKMLYEAAREPKEAVWIEGGGHENLSRFGLSHLVLDFIARRTAVGVR